jgi:hypothetical protein
MSFRVRNPLRPLAGSLDFVLTRSIFDITLIQGISKLTIADIAESTPLVWVLRGNHRVSWTPFVPEEFVLVLHELGLDQIHS